MCPRQPLSLMIVLALAGCDRPSREGGSRTGVDPMPSTVSQLLPFNEQRWISMTGNGWNYLRRTGSKDDDIVQDPASPFLPPTMLRIIFTRDMQHDSEPGVHWLALPNMKEVSTDWWMKLSRNWVPSPAGACKITFLHAAPDGQGQVYSALFGASEPHHISINTEWRPYGQRIWEPNMAPTPIFYDRWYHVQWYVRWPTAAGAGDGIIRWSVDGTVNGDYANVMFPVAGTGFHQFEFAPTLQNPPPAEQYMYIGPTFVTTR
jgi:hypothetical protein